MSVDPMGFGAGDTNLMRYVENSPTNATDPSGKEILSAGDFLGPPTTDSPDLFDWKSTPPNTSSDAGMKSKSQWQDFLLDQIGVTTDQLSGYDNFSGANQATMRKIYAFYENAFLNNPNLLWAGMAKLAGNSVWNALVMATNLGRVEPNLPYADPCYLLPYYEHRLRDELVRQLLRMNLKIFMDMAWQHAAYIHGGIAEMEARFRAGDLGEKEIRAWRLIDHGSRSGNQHAVQLGNEILLRREQEIILARGYAALARLKLGATMGRLSDSPVPGGKNFCDSVPGGDLTDFDDRWKWIVQEMLRQWNQMSAELRAALVKVPLGATNDQINGA